MDEKNDIKKVDDRIELTSFLDRSVSEFISVQSINRDMYTVESSDSFSIIIDKIFSPLNHEDSVVVIESSSPETVVGIISDTDVYRWIKRNATDYRNSHAKNIMNKTFFNSYINYDLRDTVDLMRKHDVTHIVVLNEGKEYIGWVNRQTIINKLKEDLIRLRHMLKNNDN